MAVCNGRVAYSTLRVVLKLGVTWSTILLTLRRFTSTLTISAEKAEAGAEAKHGDKDNSEG